MAKSTGFWSKDWVFGGLFSLLFVLCAWGFFASGGQTAERWLYDLGVRWNALSPNPDIAVIAIDDQSIENLGRWPWPRELHAQLIDRLSRAGAKVIGNTVLYSEAQADPGQNWVRKVGEAYFSAGLNKKLPDALPALADEVARQVRSGRASRLGSLWEQSGLSAGLADTLREIADTLREANSALATDARLARSYAEAGSVVQAYTLKLGWPRGRPDAPLPGPLAAMVVPAPVELPLIPALGNTPPIAILAERAAALGHLTTLLDTDGAQRSEPLLIRHYDEALPSLSLMLAARALNLTPADIQLDAQGVLHLADLDIGTTGDGRMLTHFYGDTSNGPPFAVDSFFDVLVENIPASKYAGKIVLIGASATGVGDSFPTPVAAAMPPAEVLAHTVSSLLQEHFYTKPAWSGGLVALVVLLIALWLALGLPKLGPGVGAALSGSLFLLLVLATPLLLSQARIWIPLGLPALMLGLGYLAVTVRNLGLTERLRASSEMESAESNRLLGLALQSQGQLDMAFDKFRRATVDEALLDALYNLAQDYERKRQFGKAITVYEYAHRSMPGYRDMEARMERAKKLNDTVMLGGTVGAATLMLSGDGLEKPRLGRYEIEKELGKGAMGTVYLGRDPKINRTVAIKTMALAQEFAEEELADVRDRFFREAETAGRLTHPNIVAIYDAGEEHDLAFIAMELIPGGEDLSDYCAPDKLLPVPDVLRAIADAADALDYAHQQSVVHRDIKPANLMYLSQRKQVKLADFGIARLTDASKTKTGMILGTPSYMSPEQVQGKKVDGRSDLFSLCTTLYQLLTGAVPFKGDSMASLMFQIASAEPAPASLRRPDLPPAIDAILKRGMAKDPATRFQRGSELAAALRALAA